MSFGHRRTDVPGSIDERYNALVNSTEPLLAVQEGAKAWFSYKGYHSMPAFLNTLNNAILRANLPSNVSTVYGEGHTAHTNIYTHTHTHIYTPTHMIPYNNSYGPYSV